MEWPVEASSGKDLLQHGSLEICISAFAKNAVWQFIAAIETTILRLDQTLRIYLFRIGCYILKRMATCNIIWFYCRISDDV